MITAFYKPRKIILINLLLAASLIGCIAYKSDNQANDLQNKSNPSIITDKVNENLYEIKKYKISLPDKLIKSSGGFYPGIGSGIEFKRELPHGKLEFIAITDRGPNYPFEKKDDKIVFFNPGFAPKIVTISVDQKTDVAVVEDYIGIKYNGRTVTGINPNHNATDEGMYDNNLNKLQPVFGLDTESVSILKNGDFVVGDEYFPSINVINHKNGNIIKRLAPGRGLPEILKNRTFNRGFEAVTVTPNGKIFAILESVLNLDSNSNKNSKIIRMIEIDLNTSITKTYAYPFDQHLFENSSKVKIGDITSIDNDNFLIIEQGMKKDGHFSNLIYKVNIKDATDISNIKLANGNDLEHGDMSDLSKIRLISKKLLIDPREHGWVDNKLEGLTVVDPFTIAITNDNDFAVEGYNVAEHTCKDNASDQCKELSAIVNPEKQKTNLWVIKFKNII